MTYPDDTDVDARARLRGEDEATLRNRRMGEEEEGIGTLCRSIRVEIRELRGELAWIRARLDSLVAVEKQLAYQGQRLTAIEKRLATLVETKLAGANTEDLKRLMAIEKEMGSLGGRLAEVADVLEVKLAAPAA